MPTITTTSHDLQAAINAAEAALDPVGRDDKPVAVRNRDLQLLVAAARNSPEDKTEEFRTAIQEAMDTLRDALDD